MTPDPAAVDPLDEPMELEEEPTWLQPPMDLLDPVPVEVNAVPIDNSARMRLIEDTLAALQCARHGWWRRTPGRR